MKRPFALLSLLLALLSGPARAADIDAGASLDSIRITSSFTGAQVLIFGTIIGQMSPTPDTDVVVELKGPVGDFVVRRKEPIGPIWLNQDRTKFHAVPGFYFVASTRPLTATTFSSRRSPAGSTQIALSSSMKSRCVSKIA